MTSPPSRATIFAASATPPPSSRRTKSIRLLLSSEAPITSRNACKTSLVVIIPPTPTRDDANDLSVADTRQPTKTPPLHLKPRLDQQILRGHRNRIFAHAFTDQHGDLRSKSTFAAADFLLSIVLFNSQWMCQKPSENRTIEWRCFFWRSRRLEKTQYR